MQDLSNQDLQHIAGGLHLGGAIMGLASGLIFGGPVGLGVAAAGLIGAQGIDNLVDLYKKP